MATAILKRCTKCLADKETSDFYRDKSKLDGLSTRCKCCIKSAQSRPESLARAAALRRAAYAADPERFKKMSEAWRRSNIQTVNAMAKAWAINNPEKRKEIANRSRKKRYQENADAMRVKAAAEYWANPEKMRARAAAYREKNRKVLREKYKEWGAKNRHIQAAHAKARHARKIQAMPSWADKAAMQCFYEEAHRLASETGLPHDVDHIVPLKSKLVCGLHVEHNLQVLPATDNRRKNNRHWPDMP
jgi:hypothetical protein